MTRLRAVLSAMAFLALVTSTFGHVPLRESEGTLIRWDLDATEQPNVDALGRLTYYLDTRGSVDVPSGMIEVTAVREAFKTWSSVKSSRLEIVEDRSRGALKQDSTDRVNLVRWDVGSMGPLTLGLTFPYSINGVMADADILLNDSPARSWRWETTTPGRDFRADVQAVLTHEIGHLLGLDHVGLGQSTMHFELPLGAIRYRSLEPDDVVGITSLYPGKDADIELGAIQGRATVKGVGNHRGVHIVALDLFTRLPAASAVTVEDGRYKLDGLPPGKYRVYALPMRGFATMVPYWESAQRGFLGEAYGTDGVNPARPELVEVKGSFTTFGIDFPNLRTPDAALEPNDSPVAAVDLALGDAAIGTAEDVKDEDWFRFTGTAGDLVSIHVDSWHFGGDADVEVRLYASDGVTQLARSQDIRPPLYDENRLGLLGEDIDALIEDRALPADGEYYIQVSFAANSNSGEALNFYVLSLFGDAQAPDPYTSTIVAEPPAIPADGSYLTTIRVIPRNLAGSILPPGTIVEVVGEGIGEILLPVAAHGDGSFTVQVRAPTVPNSESFTVRMLSDTGRAEVREAVRVEYVGPPSPLRSEFFATPHRLEADGYSTSTVELRARDSRGVEYGPFLPVTLERVGGEPLGDLGPVRDLGDGIYRMEVVAPTRGGSDIFLATIAGLTLDLTAELGYGYSLKAVVDGTLDVVLALLKKADMPRSVRRSLDKARKLLQKSSIALSVYDPKKEQSAVIWASKASKALGKARKKAEGEIHVPELSYELAEAARRHVDEVLRSIIFNPPTQKEEKTLHKAKGRLADGADSILDGSYDRALKTLARALRVAQPLR